MEKKHRTKWLLGGAVALLLVVVVIGSTTNYMGKFSMQSFDKINQKESLSEKTVKPVFNGSSSSSEEEEEIAVLMEVETDSGWYARSHDGYDSLGSWVIQYADEGSPCYGFDFQLLDFTSLGLYDLSEVFEDVRLNVTTGDWDLEDQIDEGTYSEAASATLSTFHALTGLKSGGTYYLYLHGIVKDGVDWSDESDDEKKVYLTGTCVQDSDGNEHKWSEDTTNAGNVYFEMESMGNGYGVPSSRLLPY